MIPIDPENLLDDYDIDWIRHIRDDYGWYLPIRTGFSKRARDSHEKLIRLGILKRIRYGWELTMDMEEAITINKVTYE